MTPTDRSDERRKAMTKRRGGDMHIGKRLVPPDDNRQLSHGDIVDSRGARY